MRENALPRYRGKDPLILPSPRDQSVHRQGRVPTVPTKKKGRKKKTKRKSKTRVSPRAAKGRRSGATVRRMMKSFFRFGIPCTCRGSPSPSLWRSGAFAFSRNRAHDENALAQRRERALAFPLFIHRYKYE